MNPDLNKILEIASKTPYYKELYKNKKIIRFEDLPYAKPIDLVNCPEKFVQNSAKIVSVITSTGTANKPKLIQLTKDDIDCAAKYTVNLFGSILSKNDKVITIFPYGPHASGLAPFVMQELGIKHLAVSMFLPQLAIYPIKKLGFNTLITGYPILIKLIEECKNSDIDPKDLGIKKIIVGGAYVPLKSRRYIEQTFHADIYNAYGIAEAITIGIECKNKNGYHLISANYLFPEFLLIDKENKELVITLLKRKGTQIIRYKTGDLVSLIKEPCDCGLKTPRIKWQGRTDNLLIIGHLNLYWTNEFDESILSLPIDNFLVEIDKDKQGLDIVNFLIKSDEEITKDEISSAIRKVDEEFYRQLKENIIKLEITKVKDFAEFSKTIKSRNRIMDKRKYE